MELTTRHLLEIADLSPQDITAIFNLAKKYNSYMRGDSSPSAQNDAVLRRDSSVVQPALSFEGLPQNDAVLKRDSSPSAQNDGMFSEILNQKEIPAVLKGKIVVNLFFEPSTRTRVSFEIAAKKLGAEVVNVQQEGSSVKKGETLLDTALTIQAMGCDLLVIRHSEAGAAHQLARRLHIPIVNAGDGNHAHPSQALLDAMTLIDRWGSLENKKITIVGDILHSRVARSDLELFTRLGARVVFCGPQSLVPKLFEELGASVEWDFQKAIESADAVIMLRMQSERWNGADFWKLVEPYQLRRDRLKFLKSDALIMAPGPINRSVEIDSSIADGERSLILDQVRWGLPTRMAILHLLGRGGVTP